MKVGPFNLANHVHRWNLQTKGYRFAAYIIIIIIIIIIYLSNIL